MESVTVAHAQKSSKAKSVKTIKTGKTVQTINTTAADLELNKEQRSKQPQREQSASTLVPETEEEVEPAPEVVFVIPYRNRPQQKQFCIQHLTTLLNSPSLAETSRGKKWRYEIVIAHQCDIRAFNRGAMKDIGFLAVKKKYPQHYQNILFVFNDLDTVPYANILDYSTPIGTAKHFYGFQYALGGIVVMRGADFEKTNGFPCFWGWGMEDNALQARCEKKGIAIDRSQFYPIGNPNILHLFDGVNRIINKKDPWRATHDDGIDGLCTIHHLEYEWSRESFSEIDNEPVFLEITRAFPNIHYVNVKTFLTRIRFESDHYYKYDLREPYRKVLHPSRVASPTVHVPIDDWSNIPFYPTAKKYDEWVRQYGKAEADKIVEYNRLYSRDPTRPLLPPSSSHPPHPHPHPPHPPHPPRSNQPTSSSTAGIAMNGNGMRGHGQHTYLQHALPHPPSAMDIYSPQYAKAMGVKPRATASARIRLGGVVV